MTIKYVFSDIDYTLTGYDRLVPQGNIEAIKKIKEKGVGFGLQSGRLVCALQQTLDAIDMNHSDNEYIVCGNGAIISDTNSNFIYELSINDEIINILLNYFEKDEDTALVMVTADTYYRLGHTTKHSNFAKGYSKNIEYSEAREIAAKENIYKFLIVENDEEQMAKYQEIVSKIDPEKIECVLSSSCWLEILAKGTNKGTALLKFCEIKGIDIKDILVLGDNFNDLSMFEVAGHKACPANAVDIIKEKSDYISPYDCSQNAVADILEHYILSK